MKATRLAVLGVLVWSGCSGSSPSAPAQNVAVAGLILSGTVYGVDATGRRPLVGATVDIADATTGTWGKYGNPTTDAAGHYASGTLQPLHYLARASKTGYTGPAAISLGYLEASRTLDFDLTTTTGTAAPLSVTAISPTVGSTGGGTPVRITGTGFQLGMTVTFDDGRGTASVESSTTIQATTPVHGAGTVDVVVTNPGGQAVRLTGAYTYASPLSFDFNGTWVGFALSHPEFASASRVTVLHSDMDMRFTIQNNVLTSVSCGGSAIVTSSPSRSVSDGEFSLAGTGVAMTGRIVSPVGAVGTINTAPCPATTWSATKQ